MAKTKLCMGTSLSYGISIEEQIKLYKNKGFDAFFTSWDDNIKSYKMVADECSMIYQSIHAPFHHMADMWQNEKQAKNALNDLLSAVNDCAEFKVPILVVHPYIGFELPYKPTKAGIENFGKVVALAKEKTLK